MVVTLIVVMMVIIVSSISCNGIRGDDTSVRNTSIKYSIGNRSNESNNHIGSTNRSICSRNDYNSNIISNAIKIRNSKYQCC